MFAKLKTDGKVWVKFENMQVYIKQMYLSLQKNK